MTCNRLSEILSYVDLNLAEDAPRRQNGMLPVPPGPELGIKVDENALGRPVLSIK